MTAGQTPYQVDFHAHKPGCVFKLRPLPHVLYAKHDKLPGSGLPWSDDESETDTTDSTFGGGKRIRCPKCGWQPRKFDLWSCMPACGTAWNTFDTGGRCPKCKTQWEDTACLRCHQWSKHRDWYVDAPEDAQ